jgi:adenylate cyclase
MSGFNCEYGDAVRLAKKAIEIAEAANADSARIFAYNYLGCSLAEIGDLDEALGYLDRSHREAAARGLDWMASSALRNAFATRFNHWRGLEAAALIPELRRLSKTSRRDEALIDPIEGTVAFYVEGNPEAAKQHFEHSIRVGQGALETSEINRDLCLVYAALEDFDQAQRLLPPTPSDGDRQQIVMHRYAAIRLAFDAGDLRAASQLARLALDLLRGQARIGLLELWLADKAVEVFLAAGDVSAATTLTALARLALKDPHDPFVQRMEGRIALANGDFEGAHTQLSQAADFISRSGHRDEEWRTRRALAMAMAALGDGAGAETELRSVLEAASATGHLFEANASRKQLRELGLEVAEASSAHKLDEAMLRQPQERLLTVLFVDVRGYTAMTQRQPPDDMVDRLQAFLRWSESAITRHHGLVDQYAGDALMATFNVSAMRLDHPALALQAALEIRDKAAYAGLPVGVGIATGAAVVGEFGGKLTAVGETINLASRLQSQAGAGEILLSADAYRRVGDWLKSSEQVAAETSLALKGFDEPVVAYRLHSRTPVKRAL